MAICETLSERKKNQVESEVDGESCLFTVDTGSERTFLKADGAST